MLHLNRLVKRLHVVRRLLAELGIVHDFQVIETVQLTLDAVHHRVIAIRLFKHPTRENGFVLGEVNALVQLLENGD